MAGDTPDSSDGDSENPSSSTVFTGQSIDLDVERILSTQQRLVRSIDSDVFRALADAQKTVAGIDPEIFRTLTDAQNKIAGIDQEVFETIANARKTVAGIDPSIFESYIQIHYSLNSAVVQLNSPSISTAVSGLSTPNRPLSTSPRNESQEHIGYEATDPLGIQPAETRIHDELVWDDGKWYRDRTREIAISMVDYLFWQAKNSGELTDASEEEVATAAIAAAFCITLALTGGNFVASITVAGATGGAKHMVGRAAKKRSERKQLDDKFG